MEYTYVPKVTSGKRVGSMLLDHVIMCAIVFVPLLFGDFGSVKKLTHEGPKLLADGFSFLFLGLALYLCKDCIGGRSIAKRAVGHVVLNNRTGEVANPLRCFVRNLFDIIWPIEFFVVLASPTRRIGDYVAGTRIDLYNPEQHKVKPNYGQFVLSFVLAAALTAATVLILPNFTGDLGVNYVESSYNETSSVTLNDELFRLYTDVDVKVYDSIENKEQRFVSIIITVDRAQYISGIVRGSNVEKIEPIMETVFGDDKSVARVAVVSYHKKGYNAYTFFVGDGKEGYTPYNSRVNF